jgi:gliding motility-associated peptidyl-prolyl isomerase
MKLNLSLILIFLLVLFSCKSPEARKPAQYTSGSFISKSIKRNKAIFEKEEKEILKLLEANKAESYFTSESGFWYYYELKDSSKTNVAEYGDKVTFYYDIKDLNGITILSKNEVGLQNCIIDQTNQELISGIRDGLKLMKEGETITFLFPSFKAYGYYGIENKLGTNIPIQCTVTLNSINKTNENY